MSEADHLAPPRAYAIVFVALLALLAITVGCAFVDLGHSLGLSIALGVAGLKALLIVLWFMHVKGSPPRIAMFAAAGFVWLAILATLTMSDYLTRTPLDRGPHQFRDPANVQP